MRILPVIDLKSGMVVRALAGNRKEYRPVVSQLAENAHPQTVAGALAKRCGFREVYVADLDAIAGSEPSWDIYVAIAHCGLKLILDAGVAETQRAKRLSDFARDSGCLAGVVFGSEVIRDWKSLRSQLELLKPELAIFSLDLRDGKPIVDDPEWENVSPMAVIANAVAAGFRRFIILDLAVVGTDSGPATLDLCRHVHTEFPWVELISGGGIRNGDDVTTLCDAGCNRVLVASALHDGRVGSVISDH